MCGALAGLVAVQASGRADAELASLGEMRAAAFGALPMSVLTNEHGPCLHAGFPCIALTALHALMLCSQKGGHAFDR